MEKLTVMDWAAAGGFAAIDQRFARLEAGIAELRQDIRELRALVINALLSHTDLTRLDTRAVPATDRAPDSTRSTPDHKTSG